MSYILLDKVNKEIERGECKGTVDEEYLTLFPKFGSILPFHLRDIAEIKVENYRIILLMESLDKIVLFNLRHDFDDFLRVLTKMRNEVIIKDLLMNETLRKTDVETEFIYCDETGVEKISGTSRVRLYETSLVVIPEKGEIIRIPYGSIEKISEGYYEITLNTEFGEKLILKKMGTEYELFVKTLSETLSELQNKTFLLIKELFPTMDSFSLRRLATVMKEGKAVEKSEIDSIDSKIWFEIERRIASTGLGESFSFLKELARKEKIAVGFKRGLMGDLTGEYIWFLMPIYDVEKREYGNAIAMEATGEGSGGKATYFFRITSRKEYLKYKSIEELDKETDLLIRRINRCMIDINFRREPIYLPDEKLNEAAYTKYRIAVTKIPSLQLLRNLYIGRVMHFSTEQWRKDVMDLLRFNVESQDDFAKWKK